MFKLIIMYIYSSNVESNAKKIPWYQIVNAVVQALIAALTALGVSSCATWIGYKPHPQTNKEMESLTPNPSPKERDKASPPPPLQKRGE